jgi:hypothetical protein
VQGTKVSDNIVMAGFSLPNHAFGAVKLMANEFADKLADGIIGLGRSHSQHKTLSHQRTPTPVEALVKQGLIHDVVSFKIPRPGDKNNDGQVTFG